MAIPAGRILDLVGEWCRRAEDGQAEELRLWVEEDGQIAVEEVLAGPRPPEMAAKADARRARGVPWEDRPVPEHLICQPAIEGPCYLLKGYPRCGGDLYWQEDRDGGPLRPSGAYGCLQCGATATA